MKKIFEGKKEHYKKIKKSFIACVPQNVVAIFIADMFKEFLLPKIAKGGK